jgi:hypothetical protein
LLLGPEVSGIAAVHYSLRDVNSSAGEIGAPVYIDHAPNWPVVDPDPKLQSRMFLKHAADLHCALRWRFRAGVKDQGHAIAGRDLE